MNDEAFGGPEGGVFPLDAFTQVPENFNVSFRCHIFIPVLEFSQQWSFLVEEDGEHGFSVCSLGLGLFRAVLNRPLGDPFLRCLPGL